MCIRDSDRGAVPVVEVGQLAVLLMGQAEARGTAEPEFAKVLVQPGLPQLLRQLDRAHVGRLGEDIGNGQGTGVRVVVRVVSDPQGAGHVDHRLRGDQALLEGGRQGDQLVDRAGLVVGGDGQVVGGVGDGPGGRVALLVGQGQDLAGLGVRHDGDAALGAGGVDRGGGGAVDGGVGAGGGGGGQVGAGQIDATGAQGGIAIVSN